MNVTQMAQLIVVEVAIFYGHNPDVIFSIKPRLLRGYAKGIMIPTAIKRPPEIRLIRRTAVGVCSRYRA